jgi:cell division protease FtsH
VSGNQHLEQHAIPSTLRNACTRVLPSVCVPCDQLQRAQGTGAADDLERASALVRQMVTRFGMSDALGPLTYGRPMAAQFLKSPFDMEERNYSERTAERIDDESRRIVDEIRKRVTEILSKRREPMERISRELIRKETLERAELDTLLAAAEPERVAALAPVEVA